MRHKAAIGESDNSGLDNVGVSMRSSDQPGYPTLEQPTAALARPLGRQREFLGGGNVDRLG